MPNNFHMVHHWNEVKLEGGIGFYDIDTVRGQGGCPVYLSSNKSQVIGIHSGYHAKSRLNICCPITK